MRRPIIIGGGVGPMAGVLLHQKIIENTTTDGTDQSHHDVIHLSLSPLIPDRTDYLTGTVRENPAYGMAEVCARASHLLADWSTAGSAVAGVPCNTFHAPEIFDLFQEIGRERFPGIEVIHMIDMCITEVIRRFGAGSTIGVMTTTGTRNAGIYSRALSHAGLTVVEVPEIEQAALHDVIYNPDWGLKARSPATTTARSQLLHYLDVLRGQGAVVIILGCTELPLGAPGSTHEGTDLIDPLDTLAAALVRRAEL